MSDNLQIINGEAVFMGREDAWHRLGDVVGDNFDIPTMAERKPELVMPVRFEPTYVYTEDGLTETPLKGAIVRADGCIVGEGVGKESYGIVQQQDVFEWAEQIAEIGDFAFISAGILREGRQFFATLDSGGFSLGGLRINQHLTVGSSHDGTIAVTALYSNQVVVCANTWAAAVSTAIDRLTVRHTTFVEDRMATALQAIKGVREYAAGEQAAFEALAAVRLSTRAFDLCLDGVLPSLDEKARGADQREAARETIRTLSTSPVVADLGGTGLAFVQSVNTYENWNAPVRGARGRSKDMLRAERQFDAVVKGKQPLTRKAIERVLVNA